MPFYHVTSGNWSAGDIIEPGSWGRTIRQFRPGGPVANDWTSVKWEIALETARLQFADEAPSRLECVFACESEEFANLFRQRFRAGSNVVRVEAVDPTVGVHRGDFMLISGHLGANPAYVDYMPKRSVAYWTTKPAQGHAELLIAGPVRVL